MLLIFWISIINRLFTGGYSYVYGFIVLQIMAEVLPHCWQRKCVSKRGKKARHKRSRSVPAVLRTPEKKRKCWTDSQMKAAMEVVGKG